MPPVHSAGISVFISRPTGNIHLTACACNAPAPVFSDHWGGASSTPPENYVDERIGRSEITPGRSKPESPELSGARITPSDSPEERGFKAPESFAKPESVPFYLETESRSETPFLWKNWQGIEPAKQESP